MRYRILAALFLALSVPAFPLDNARKLMGVDEAMAWAGSSVGPTMDGRLGIDLSAPGDLVITTYPPRSYWATARFNVVQTDPVIYGRAGRSARPRL